MKRIRVSRVVAFILVTLGLTWGLMWITAIRVGSAAFLDPVLPPLGMLVPAFVALHIEIFVAQESPLYFRKSAGPARAVIYAYLLITLLVGLVTLLSWFTQVSPAILGVSGSVLFVLWTLLVIQCYRRYGDSAFRRVGLQLGNPDVGVRLVIGILLFFLIQAGLNWALDLGEFQGIQERIEGIPVSGWLYPFALVAFLLLAVIGNPLGSLAATFGEEYGWRGFLLRELSPVGWRLAAIITGLVWAVWHIPIILSGVHTYPPTLTGFLFAGLFFTLWGIVQSYAVLKTGSVWVAAFLHGVVNSVYAFVLNYLVRPENKLFSFGLGAYGLACLLLVVLFIWRDPVWQQPVVVD